MEVLIPIIILVVVGGLQFLSQSPFRKVAREFNLSGEFPAYGPPKQLLGMVDGYTVYINSIGSNDSLAKELNIAIRLHHTTAQSLRIETAVWLERFTQDDMEVADPKFDRKFILKGANFKLLAFLNSRRRLLLSGWKKGGLVIDEGRLIYNYVQNTVANFRLGTTLIELRELAEALDQDELSVQEALVDSARNDPHPPYRRLCVEALLRDMEANEFTLEFAREHLRDPDLEIQAWAAEALGEEGIPSLLSVVTQAADNEPAAILALRALATHKHKDAEQGLLHALAIPLDALRIEILEALIEKQRNFRWSSWTEPEWREHIPRRMLELPEAQAPLEAAPSVLSPLVEALGLFCEGETRSQAIHCLSKILTHALSSSSTPVDVLSKSIESLEKIGGRNNIALLNRLSEHGPKPLRKTALRATRTIQERLGLSQGDGHLSLVENHGGEVSLVHEKGNLSLSEPTRKNDVNTDN